jgi:exopolyphosphatase/pppGpp-phosphohydrolase
MRPGGRRLAVIDMGSNSFRLVVYGYERGGWWSLTDEIRVAFVPRAREYSANLLEQAGLARTERRVRSLSCTEVRMFMSEVNQLKV